jgi:hypothetical protein
LRAGTLDSSLARAAATPIHNQNETSTNLRQPRLWRTAHKVHSSHLAIVRIVRYDRHHTYDLSEMRVCKPQPSSPRKVRLAYTPFLDGAFE